MRKKRDSAEQQYIFTLTDFFDLWEDFADAIKRGRQKTGIGLGDDMLITAKVIDLLAWYNISVEDMVKIKLYNVSDEGIEGYNIDFDPLAIDVFMEYKRMSGIYIDQSHKTNYKEFKQNTLIRNTSNKPIDAIYITTMFNKGKNVNVSEDEEWLRKLFRIRDVQYSGQYSRIYDKVKDVYRTQPRVMNPEFDKALIEEGLIFNLPQSKNNYKRGFEDYFVARKEWDKTHQQKEIKEETVAENSVTEQEISEVTVIPQESQSSEHNIDEIIKVCELSLEAMENAIALQQNQIKSMRQLLQQLKK